MLYLGLESIGDVLLKLSQVRLLDKRSWFITSFSKGASGVSFNIVPCVKVDIEAAWIKMRSNLLEGLNKDSKYFKPLGHEQVETSWNKLKQVMQRFFVYSLRFTLKSTNKKQVFSGKVIWVQSNDQLQQSFEK